MMQKGNHNIINVADDFGISKLANKNILNLVKSGKVDRVSVLISQDNSNIKDEEVKMLMQSRVKLDLHLDYQVFLFEKKQRKLKEGSFMRLCNFALGYMMGKGRARLVERAWESQIEGFIALFGKVPDGINSHQYIHLFPAYFKVVLKLAKKYRIPYVRYGKDGLLSGGTMVYRILSGLRKITDKEFRKNRSHTSDFLVSLDWIGNINGFLSHLPKGSVEIVCHPERKDEYNLLMKHF